MSHHSMLLHEVLHTLGLIYTLLLHDEGRGVRSITHYYYDEYVYAAGVYTLRHVRDSHSYELRS